MGGFSSLNPTKDFRGSVISRLHIFPKKPFIRNRAVFPFFVLKAVHCEVSGFCYSIFSTLFLQQSFPNRTYRNLLPGINGYFFLVFQSNNYAFR